MGPPALNIVLIRSTINIQKHNKLILFYFLIAVGEGAAAYCYEI